MLARWVDWLRWERAVLVAASCGLAALGCSAILGIDDLVADLEPGQGGAGTAQAASTGANASVGAGCSDLCGTPGCGDCPTGPRLDMSPLGGAYRIDAYEVTNAQYRAFLDAN